MPQGNPLQKYFRQPKIYISLPSKGVYYERGSFQGDSANMPVYGMTGMDEILMKTPDALFNGESTVKVIESCCPYIQNAWKIPSIDVDCLLIAVRIATYGPKMDITHRCPACQNVNDYEIDLNQVMGYLQSQIFDGKIQVGDLIITIRPLRYEEVTKFNVENYKLQKMLYQLSRMENSGNEDQTLKTQDSIYQRISEMQVELFEISIENVQLPDTVVDDPEMIGEWIRNSDKEFYKKIKEKLEANKRQWDIPEQEVQCEECKHKSQITVNMDQANFFARN
jgi:hypothetical protein